MGFLDDYPSEPASRGKGGVIAPAREKFKVKLWYADIAVANDLSRLADAISYYDTVMADGERYLVPKGDLEKLMMAQAGIVHFYETAANDADKIHKWLEGRLGYEKAKKYTWFLSAEGRNAFGDLKATELKQYVEADEDIYELSENLLFIEYSKSKLASLVENLRQRGIYLSMVSKLRTAGQTEIMIDAGRESPLDA